MIKMDLQYTRLGTKLKNYITIIRLFRRSNFGIVVRGKNINNQRSATNNMSVLPLTFPIFIIQVSNYQCSVIAKVKCTKVHFLDVVRYKWSKNPDVLVSSK